MDKFDFQYIDGDVKLKDRNNIKVDLELLTVDDNKPKILIASYGTLSTGVSIKNLHNLILAESTKSEQIIIQSIGRLLRLFTDKDYATIFDLIDIYDGNVKYPQNILYSHYTERKKFYIKREYPFTEHKFNLWSLIYFFL